MDRTLDVRTPESIEFSYELAGIGSRFLAVAIDLLLQIGTLTLFFWGLSLIATHGGAQTPLHRAPVNDRFWINAGVAIVVAVVFIVLFGYFIVFEALWNGQTPGKRVLGLRVVRDGGYPIDFTASLVRNLIRIGEMVLAFYAISGVVAVLSEENKRVGDFAAGTIVVRDAPMQRTGDLLKAVLAEPAYAATAYVSGDERALIRRFLDRRDQLDAPRRKALAAQIAARIRGRLPTDLQRLDDESLLERL